MATKRIVPVLYAESLKEIVSFYTDVLGFQVDTAIPNLDDPELVIFDRDDASLMYSKVGPMPRSSSQINVEVDDIYAVVESLPDSVKPEWGPEHFDYGRTEFGVRDPNNILVVFSMPTRA
jgi:catechol 2,3-dioxygenase-like lactoylglutathione lyase family enzyme